MMMGTSNGSSCSICAIAACKAERSGEPGAYVFYRVDRRLDTGLSDPEERTIGSLSTAGTLKAPNWGDMMAETIHTRMPLSSAREHEGFKFSNPICLRSFPYPWLVGNYSVVG